MALTLNSNCGFVSVHPTTDPNGSGYEETNGNICAIKDTSPSGSYRVTELGWYCSRKDNSTARAYQMAIYTHDAGNNRPNAVVGSISSGSNFNAVGWWKYASLSITLTSSTTYWITKSNAAGAETITIDLVGLNGSGYGRLYSTPTLPSPWTSAFSASDTDGMAAIYALYEATNTNYQRAVSGALPAQTGSTNRKFTGKRMEVGTI